MGYQKRMHKTVGKAAQDIIKKFRIQEATGLNLADAVVVLEDLIEAQARNLIDREKFTKTKKRALFLPHCSRKYMDNRCKAQFDSQLPSYICAHCSSDCAVGIATLKAQARGYDVYILPGGSCIPKILKNRSYEGVIGVACGQEATAGTDVLTAMNVVTQSVPLIKNGCSNTAFNMESLLRTL